MASAEGSGLEAPLVTRAEDTATGRRRLYYLLPDGRRAVSTVKVADDTPELRERIGAALYDGKRLLIRGGEALEG